MIDAKRFEENMRSEQRLQTLKMELEITKTKVRKQKIDILKNGKKKDKINLLIEERLQELEAEESASSCNINPEMAKINV